MQLRNKTLSAGLYSLSIIEIAWDHNQPDQVTCQQPHTQKDDSKKAVNARSSETTNKFMQQ